MSFGTRTPESLLPRSDSKNPATTCKGITSNGRPCRRGINSSPSSSPNPSPTRPGGVLAVLRDEGPGGNTAAVFFCWQHKDQAEDVAKPNANRTDLMPIPERTSLDTLVDRVGVLNLADERPSKDKSRRRGKNHRKEPAKKNSLPSDWQKIPGPLMSVPTDMLNQTPQSRPNRKPVRKSKARASLICCIRIMDDEEENVPPRKSRPTTSTTARPSTRTIKPSGQASAQSSITPQPGASKITRKPVSASPGSSQAGPSGRRTSANLAPLSPSPSRQSNASQTQELLSFIPSHLSPQTTSTLLIELSKPISEADAEGYIYMFWLTPDCDDSKPRDDDATDLLEAPSNARPGGQRRSSDVLQRYASVREPGQGQTSNPTKTILLKIGRAENVHRRLSQWTKQCGKNITLIRYYPYTSSSGPLSRASAGPRKVLHVHRVERLIHIELGQIRVTEQGACEVCGKEHREWFEVEATKSGLKDVDAVIRRWVGWAESQR